MNDSELSSMVRESVAGVRSSTPVDQIISRGHAVRARRRRFPAAAGALVVAGGAALGVTALAPSGHPAPAAAGKAGGHPAAVRLDDWTVAKQANGDIVVTIRQLQHPAGLQATLRADGLPAHVSFSSDSPCQPYISPKLAMVVYRWFDDGRNVVMTIDPSQLPSRVGVEIALEKMEGRPGYVGAGIVLVHASRQCTG